MKNKIINLIIIVSLIFALFILTGCSNNVEDNAAIQKKEQITNTLEQEDTNINVVGEWKATNTNNDTYSLGWLYGTSITYGNELKFNEDGTYSLGLGVTYWQEGKYELDGNTIKLTETEYKGDNPDKKVATELLIDNKQIVLVETEDNQKINVIFSNINGIEDEKKSNISDINNETIANSPETTKEELKIGDKTIKFGTYTGIDGATGDTLVMRNDNTATLNGTKYAYEVGDYNFSQDSSNVSYQNGIIFKNSDGSIAFSLYLGDDGSLRDDPMTYVYSGK